LRLPTRRQALLLRAALCRGDDALTAWTQWRSRLDSERLDETCYQLLPILYWNLHQHRVTDTLLPFLKLQYQVTWYKNVQLFRHVGAALRALRSNELETLLLKGAALIPLYYRDYGLRPTNDVDVLVQPGDVALAAKTLTSLGWRIEGRDPLRFPERTIAVTREAHFEDPSGCVIDLHWHVLPESCYPGADNEFWSGALPMDFEQISVLCMNPTDQFLHVCVHGTPIVGSGSVLRRICDAMKILQSCERDVDWTRLIAQARKHSLGLQLLDSLACLEDVFWGTVPWDVLDALRSEPCTWDQRIVSRYLRLPRKGGVRRILFHYAIFWRRNKDLSLPRKLLAFVTYLRDLWALNHHWQVPFSAVLKLVRQFMRAWDRP